jgi:hypothetical protein
VLGQSLRHPALLLSERGKPGTRRLQDCDDFCLRRREACDEIDRCYARHAFQIATATRSLCSNVLKGYPVSMSKKKRVCVVTYRHSGDQRFENTFPRDPKVNNL